jgi:hypothetical protein
MIQDAFPCLGIFFRCTFDMALMLLLNRQNITHVNFQNNKKSGWELLRKELNNSTVKSPCCMTDAAQVATNELS